MIEKVVDVVFGVLFFLCAYLVIAIGLWLWCGVNIDAWPIFNGRM